MKSFFVFFLIFLIHFAYGRDDNSLCDSAKAYMNYEQAKEEGIVKNHIQNDQHLGDTRDQDNIGYCYAYTGADLLEHWLKKNGQMPKNENVSAVAVGLNDQKYNFKKMATEFHYEAIKKRVMKAEISKLAEKSRRKTDELLQLSLKEAGLIDQLQKSHPDHPFFDLRLKKKHFDVNMGYQGEFPEMALENADHDKFFQEIYKRAASADKVKAITEEIQKLNAEISYLGNLMSHIEGDKYNRVNVPEGGRSRDALEKSWPNICFESEVNSRDTYLKDIFEKHREFFLEHPYAADDLSAALGHIFFTQYDDVANYCPSYEIMQKMFPGFGLNSVGEYRNLVNGIADYEVIFNKILEESCRKKTFKKNPEYKEYGVVGNLYIPISGNQDIIDGIDEALKKGDIAEISYRSQILDSKNVDNRFDDYHSSAVIGSSNICGEPHYIVRNSHGREACIRQLAGLERSLGKKEENDEIAASASECSIIAKSIADLLYENCKKDSGAKSGTDSECSKKRLAYLYREEVKCGEKLQREKIELFDYPYFCDYSGNYIIKKKYLKKGLYGATVIVN